MLTKEAANMYTLRARYRRNEPLEIAHTTTLTSRRVQRNQTVYSYGPGTFSPIYAPGQFRSVDQANLADYAVTYRASVVAEPRRSYKASGVAVRHHSSMASVGVELHRLP